MSAIDELRNWQEKHPNSYNEHRSALIYLDDRVAELQKRMDETVLHFKAHLEKMLPDRVALLEKFQESVEQQKQSVKFGPVLNDAKPAPDYCTCGGLAWWPREVDAKDTEDAVERYAERLVAWYAFPEPDELRQILREFAVEVIKN